MDIHGISNSYGGQLLTASYTLAEYSHPDDLKLNWLAGAYASIEIFSLEIQRSISHIYFNRFWGGLSLRNQIYRDDNGLNKQGISINDLRLIQSLMFRVNLKFTFLPIQPFPVSLTPYICGVWKFTNNITGEDDLWGIFIGADLQY
jgi:hypothetical protein